MTDNNQGASATPVEAKQPSVSKSVTFRKPFERLSNVDEVEAMQVIRVKSLVGEGDFKGSPMRQITEYFGLDGERLARVDRLLDKDVNQLGIWADTKGNDLATKDVA